MLSPSLIRSDCEDFVDALALLFCGLNTARQRLFKTPQGYVLQATTPCVVAYGYARIRRLVRLGGGR
ncbi:hypothetical protein EMIT0P100_70267 [Pseudomonas sp. IT-P100]